jgi:hypothetical protein
MKNLLNQARRTMHIEEDFSLQNGQNIKQLGIKHHQSLLNPTNCFILP